MSPKKTCIFGTGGFGREVLCLLIDNLGRSGVDYRQVACFMIDDENYTVNEVMEIPVIRKSEFDPSKYNVVVAVGDPVTRKKIVESLPGNTEYATLIHHTAILSHSIEIGEGSIICAGCILTCNIKIGKHAQLNLQTTVGHDCVVGDYFTTAPGARISGISTIGDEVYFGTNAAVRQKIHVCDHITIGMGATVVKDLEESGTYVGSPAHKIERHQAN